MSTTTFEGNPNLVKTEVGRILDIGWRLTRPHTLTASFIPVLIGSALALNAGALHFGRLVAMLLASLLIQAGTNVINEYYDFKRGLDSRDSVGIGGTIVRDGVPAPLVLRIGLVMFGLAIILGVYVAAESSWWVLVIGLAAMLVGYGYSAGPRPIAYTPFGELVSGILMGGLIVVLSFFIQTNYVNGLCLLIATPPVLFIGAILMANNLRDLENDQRHGRRTLAIVLGRTVATQVFAGMLAAAYLVGIGSWIWALHSAWPFLALASVLVAVRAVRLFQRGGSPAVMGPAMKATAAINTQFGLGLVVGLLLIHATAR